MIIETELFMKYCFQHLLFDVVFANEQKKKKSELISLFSFLFYFGIFVSPFELMMIRNEIETEKLHARCTMHKKKKQKKKKKNPNKLNT